MDDFPSRLQEALVWHAEGNLSQAWTAYEALAPVARQTPVYSLALTLLALQTGQSALAQQGLQRFVEQAPTAGQQVASVLQLPVLLWPVVLFYFKTQTFALLSSWPRALTERLPHLPPSMAAQARYLQLLLGFVFMPALAVQAAQDFLQRQEPLPLPMAPQALWAHAARAEVLRYLRHQQRRRQALPLAEQIHSLRQEIAHAPLAHDQAVAYDQLARLYLLGHQEPQAQAAFAQAARFEPTPFRQQQAALCHAPLLPQEPAAIEAEYQRLWAAVNTVPQPLLLEQVLGQAEGGAFTLFDWNYVHPQDHLLRQHYARCFQWQRPLPTLSTASHRALGIVVTPGQEGMFYFAHHVLLRQLSAEVSELHLHIISFAPHAIWEHLQAVCPGLQVHCLSGQWGSAFSGPAFYQQMMALRQWGFQWVYFWEVGTDALSFLLPFFRLAPVQWTSWGSVSSTGHPDIDVFMTTPLLTPPELAQAQFTEHCVYLPQMSVGFLPEELPEIPVEVSEAAIETAVCRIGCLHTPRKNSAAFLEALAAIVTRHLQRYPHMPVQLVMIESPNPYWQEHFARRVQQALGEYANCVLWLSRLSPTDFDHTLARMDFLLDAFPFGGGKLVYDSLRYGVPMVSLQGSHLRGRIPSCFYTELAIDEEPFTCITTVAAYIDTALALIQQPERRQQLRERILKARHHLTRRALATDFCAALDAMLCR